MAVGIRRLEKEAKDERASSMERPEGTPGRDGTDGWFSPRLV
jgi:hypothetical protein